MKNKYILKKKLPLRPYSKEESECHKYATKKEIEKFGIKKFRKVMVLIPQNPDDMIGENTHKNIYISKVVPEKPAFLREEIYYHEKMEQMCLKNKRKHN